EEDGFNMQELSPDAEWMREASFFSWDEVSTVSIEDSYAQSLLAVAGSAPALSPPSPHRCPQTRQSGGSVRFGPGTGLFTREVAHGRAGGPQRGQSRP